MSALPLEADMPLHAVVVGFVPGAAHNPAGAPAISRPVRREAVRYQAPRANRAQCIEKGVPDIADGAPPAAAWSSQMPATMAPVPPTRHRSDRFRNVGVPGYAAAGPL